MLTRITVIEKTYTHMKLYRILLIPAILTLLPLQGIMAVDWKARWIGAPWDGEEYVRTDTLPAPEFRKTFDVTRKVTSATAYVTGLGFFEFYVNGVKAGDEVLCPNETSYSHRIGIQNYFINLDDTHWRNFRVNYLTYDIKDLLVKGTNEIGALIGNGFYATGRTRWVEPYGTPRFICQVEIKYSDGTSQTIVSDDTWHVRKSAILLNDLYDGEIYDARLKNSGKWMAASYKKAPDGELVPQEGPADRVVEILKPKSITKLEEGKWEVDFGDYVSGWIRLMNFQAPEGTVIEIEHPIETAGNGVYKYISDGTKVQSYAPRFCWWMYEKIIISGWHGTLTAANIQGEVVHSDIKVASKFECSNPLLMQINTIWRRAETDNMHLGVATDCPHREKGPYTGDGQVSAPAVMHNYDARAFYRKWLRDMADCQDTETGYVPNGAPWHPGCGGGVPWGAAMCVIPWEYYSIYGDRDVLEENYVPMKEYVRFLNGWRQEDGTVSQQLDGPDQKYQYWKNLGEWCPPYNLPSEKLVHTWYLWRCATFTAKAAEALGHPEEAKRYNTLAADVAAAFHKAFYDPETGSYGAGSGIATKDGYGTGDGVGKGDGSNIFALAMGVPSEYRDRVLDAVRNELKVNNGHLNTGIYGSSLFFEVLCQNGMTEEAYEAMNKRDFPSFGWWIEQGAKTTWEQWNGTASRCHPMFGGALVWMYRWLCGIQIDEAEPGYRHIILKPTPAGDLTWASYTTESDFGPIAVRWEILKGEEFLLKVTVPEGAHATAFLPDGSAPVELPAGKHRLTCKLL